MGTSSIPEISIVLFSAVIVLAIFIAPTAMVIWLNTNTNIGTKYSRLKYWLWSIAMMICLVPASMASMLMKHIDTQNLSNITKTTDIATILLTMIIFMLPSYVWINTLVNRIRDYGSNPWIALWTVVPLVNIFIGLYYGIAKHKTQEKQSNPKDASLAKAVYNHSKDIASEVKPAIDEYKNRHQTTVDNEAVIAFNEDEIYEKVMIEIENDEKVKSTWAKAFSQSEGEENRAQALYIKMRVEEIKNNNQNKEINAKEDNSTETNELTKLLKKRENSKLTSFEKAKLEYLIDYENKQNFLATKDNLKSDLTIEDEVFARKTKRDHRLKIAFIVLIINLLVISTLSSATDSKNLYAIILNCSQFLFGISGFYLLFKILDSFFLFTNESKLNWMQELSIRELK